MKATILIASLLTALNASAAAPSDAPAGTTGMCKDGTYSQSPEKKGACRGHQGVKDWYGETTPTKEMSPQTSSRAPMSSTATTPSTPAPTATTTSITTTKQTKATTPMGEPAAGGGAGKVWANTSTKVYHCQGDKYYGTTKHGDYMSESDAKTKGYHADHGKACA